MITIGDGIPTDGNIRANAHALARYAALCQEAGIVPIVEPEVLMDADNTLEECWEVTTRTLHETFDALYEDGLDLQGLLLKPNMVISGKGCAHQASAEEIAQATVDCFLGVVPAAVPGIVFLSGGQSEVQATENLNAINQIGGPWVLSYSYGRALQASALEAWARRPRECGSRAGGVHSPRAHELARRRRRVERGDGAAGTGLTAAPPSSRTLVPRTLRAV